MYVFDKRLSVSQDMYSHDYLNCQMFCSVNCISPGAVLRSRLMNYKLCLLIETRPLVFKPTPYLDSINSNVNQRLASPWPAV